MKQSLKGLKSSKNVEAKAKGYRRLVPQSGRFARGRKSPRIARINLKNKPSNTLETAIDLVHEDESNNEKKNSPRKRRKLIGYEDDESPNNETTDCKIISGRKLRERGNKDDESPNNESTDCKIISGRKLRERVAADRSSDCRIISSSKGKKEKQQSVVKFQIGSSVKKSNQGKKMKTAKKEDMGETSAAGKREESYKKKTSKGKAKKGAKKKDIVETDVFEKPIGSSSKKKRKERKRKSENNEDMEEPDQVDKKLSKKRKRKSTEKERGTDVMEENNDEDEVLGKRNDWFGIRTRSSPLQFFKGIRALQDDQKEAVRRMGFGKLIKFKVDGIPAKLAHYVVDRFKPKKMQIRVPSGKIKVDKESIFKLLGIPNMGMKIHDMEEMDEKEQEVADWKDRYPGRFVAPTEIVKKIKTAEDEDTFNFRLDFLMLFLAVMVECHQQGRCKLKILQKFKAGMDFKNIDWCDYILEALKKCKRKWISCDKSKIFAGPLTILTLLYVESIECKGMKLDNALSPIEYWDRSRLKKRETLEIKGGGFGRGKFTNFLEKNSSTVDEADYNEEQFVLADKVADIGNLIDSAFKTKVKIEKKLKEVYNKEPQNEDILSLVARYDSVFEVGFKKTEKQGVEGTNAEAQIREVVSDLANELNVRDMDNQDGYSSEDDDMDDMVDGNGGDNIDKIGGARKGHVEASEQLPVNADNTMRVELLAKGKTDEERGSGDNEVFIADITRTEHEKTKEKQSHGGATKKLCTPVRETVVAGTLHKNKCDAVEMEFQHLCTPVAKTVMQAGGQENETGKKGGVDDMKKGTTTNDDTPSFSLGVSQIEVQQKVNEPGGVDDMKKGATTIDDIPSFSLGVSQIEVQEKVNEPGSLSNNNPKCMGVQFAVNERVQHEVTERDTHDKNNALKGTRAHLQADPNTMVKGRTRVDDCPSFSLGLSQIENKTQAAETGGKSDKDKEVYHSQFIPDFMFVKEDITKIADNTRNVSEKTNTKAKENKGKNATTVEDPELVDNSKDCGSPTVDLGLTQSEKKSCNEIAKDDGCEGSGVKSASTNAKFKFQSLTEQIAKQREICISRMESSRRNPFTEKVTRIVRRVDISSNVTREENNVWDLIFTKQAVEARDGSGMKSTDKGKRKVEPVGVPSSISGGKQEQHSNPDLDVLFRSAYDVEANRSMFQSLAPKTRVIDEVINCWVEVLNYEERYKEPGSVSRLFVGTKAIIGWMLNDENATEEQRIEKFSKNMKAAVYGDDSLVSLQAFELVLFPIVEFEHYYLIVFDLENAIIKVIDNWGDMYPLVRLTDSKDYFSKDSAFKVKHLFVKYLYQVNHPKKAELEMATITKVDIEWATKSNLHDCGVFVMRHMEKYMGEGKPFDCGFSRNGQKKLKELRRLRTKYAAYILLSDANVLKDKIEGRAAGKK